MKVFPNIALAWMCLCFTEYIYLLKEEYDPKKHNTISSIVSHNPKFILTTNIMTPFVIIYETMDMDISFIDIANANTNNDWKRLTAIASLVTGLHGVIRTTEHTTLHNLFAVQTFSAIVFFMEHMKGRSRMRHLMLLLNLSIVIKIILKKLLDALPNIFAEECMFVLIFAVSYLL